MSTPILRATLSALALAAAAAPALAQYKVVGPDGSITYTDRPPATGNARISALSSRGGAPTPVDASLPFELRQAVGRFPVTLFTTAQCPACDSGRQWLQQRGVPYSEKRIASEEDIAALEKLVGSRAVPVLTIGSQALNGFQQTEWGSYLDIAGYPRTSRLPRSWQPPLPQPLSGRPAVAAAPAAPASDVELPSLPAAQPPEPGIRF